MSTDAPDLPILMYHSVPSRSVSAETGSVPLGTFSHQMRLLLDDGWRLAGISAALRARATEPALRVAAITFDDGFADIASAADVLGALGGSCTAYIVTDFADRGDRGQFLDWDGVRAIHNSGVEIGSHTCSHPQLDIAEPQVAEHELWESRARLEQQLGAEVLSVAYPYGYCSRRVTRLAAEAGYHSGCRIGRRTAHSDHPLALPRLQPRGEMSDRAFLDMVHNGERGLAPRAKHLAGPGWRVSRRAAARLRGADR